jgi:hypothetical protein
LRDLASPGGGFQEAVRRRAGVRAIRCLAARRYPDIELHATVEPRNGGPRWEYELAFKQERPSKADEQDPDRLTQTHLEQVNVNREFRELAVFFQSIRYLHIVPQLIREPDRSVGRSNDPFGGDFLEQLAKSPDKTRDARLRRIRDALRVAVSQLADIELWRDDRGTPHLRGKYEHWRPQGAWQTEEQFSDGTLRLMGLLWATLEGGGPLLLEEPELSLHPEVVRFLPQMFARMQRRTGRQIILSTHSPDLLRDDGIGLDEVLLLHPGAEGTAVTPGNKLRGIRALLEGGMTIAEAVIPKTRPARAEQLALFADL